MGTVPTIPSHMSDNTSPSISTLNQLSSAVNFLCNDDVRPTWHTYKVATQSIPVTTWTTVSYGTIAYDSDSMTAPSGGVITINTQGYYKCEATADFLTGTTVMNLLGSFLITAGSSNPNHSVGTSQRFHQRGGESVGAASGAADTAICCTGICPWVCYPGDTIVFQVYTTVAVTLNNNVNTTYQSGRFVSNFTGQWLRSGT